MYSQNARFFILLALSTMVAASIGLWGLPNSSYPQPSAPAPASMIEVPSHDRSTAAPAGQAQASESTVGHPEHTVDYTYAVVQDRQYQPIGEIIVPVETYDPRGVEEHSGYAYVLTREGYLYTYDLSDLVDVESFTSYDSPLGSQQLPNGSGLLRNGNFMYAYGENGLTVLDVEDPVHPVVIGSKETVWIYNLVMHDNYLIAPGNGLIAVYSVLDPANPTLLSNLYATYKRFYSAAVYGDVLYAFEYRYGYPVKGFWVIDFSDPTSLSLIRRIEREVLAYHLRILDDQLIECTESLGWGGFVGLWALDTPEAPVFLDSLPADARACAQDNLNIITNGDVFRISDDTLELLTVFDPWSSQVSGYPYGSVVTQDHVFLAQSGRVLILAKDAGTCSPIEATATIVGGVDFFHAESGEHQIPAPVFARGSKPVEFLAEISEPGLVDNIKVEIFDASDRLVDTVGLTAAAGQWRGAWDWTSAGWTDIPGEIPIGTYNARFTIVDYGCPLVLQDKPFYVIFDPGEVVAPERFAFNETGIWFGSGPGLDRARTYALHPDDFRVFDRAIEQVQGETSQYSASSKLLTFENGMFEYDLGWHGNDVIELIEEETEAQCADDANMLTALLRAIGIPSHPVTGDADREHGAINWSFDTWTEARMEGPAGELWYALHPHEGAGLGPVPRSVAGTWGVATKTANDVIIMADSSWDPKDVSDSEPDLRFKYNLCGEPTETFDYQASWIDHLCLDYWGVGHWVCWASSPEIAEETPQITLTLDRDQYTVGDTVDITVAISNPTTMQIDSSIVFSITADYPASKRFPDQTLHSDSETAVVDPGNTATITLHYDLPMDVSADNWHFVEASYAGAWSIAAFTVAPRFDYRVRLPSTTQVGSNLSAQLTVTNTYTANLENIGVTLSVPMEFATADPYQQWITALEPGVGETLVWALTALSESEVAQLEFLLTSENGGNSSVLKGVEIVPPRLFLPLILRSTPEDMREG